MPPSRCGYITDTVHASSDPAQAYLAAQSKIDLSTPSQSRFVVRLRDQFHHCWAMAPGGAPDCPGSARRCWPRSRPMRTKFGNQRRSDARGLEALSSGRGYRPRVPAATRPTSLRSTSSRRAPAHGYDTSGVAPAADLTLMPGIGWSVDGYQHPAPAAGAGLRVGQPEAAQVIQSRASTPSKCGDAGQRCPDKRLYRDVLGRQHQPQHDPRTACHAVRGAHAPSKRTTTGLRRC